MPLQRIHCVYYKTLEDFRKEKTQARADRRNSSCVGMSKELSAFLVQPTTTLVRVERLFSFTNHYFSSSSGTVWSLWIGLGSRTLERAGR